MNTTERKDKFPLTSLATLPHFCLLIPFSFAHFLSSYSTFSSNMDSPITHLYLLSIIFWLINVFFSTEWLSKLELGYITVCLINSFAESLHQDQLLGHVTWAVARPTCLVEVSAVLNLKFKQGSHRWYSRSWSQSNVKYYTHINFLP